MRIIILLLTLSFSLLASIGQIAMISGTVEIERAKQSISAFAGVKIEKADIIKVLGKGKAQLFFNDETVVTLGSDSVFKIEEYLAEEAKEEVKFSLSSGSFKAITGRLGKLAHKRFKLKTKTATMGIRGTHFMGVIGELGDQVACTSGAITVTPNLTNETMLVEAGMFTNISRSGIMTIPQVIDSAVLEQMEGTFSSVAKDQTTSSSIAAREAKYGVKIVKSDVTTSDIKAMQEAGELEGEEILVSSDGSDITLDIIEDALGQNINDNITAEYKLVADYTGKSIYAVLAPDASEAVSADAHQFVAQNYDGYGYFGVGDQKKSAVDVRRTGDRLTQSHFHSLTKIGVAPEGSAKNLQDDSLLGEVIEAKVGGYTTSSAIARQTPADSSGDELLIYDNMAQFMIYSKSHLTSTSPVNLELDAKYYGIATPTNMLIDDKVYGYKVGLDSSIHANFNNDVLSASINFIDNKATNDLFINFANQTLLYSHIDQDGTLSLDIGKIEGNSLSVTRNATDGFTESATGNLYGFDIQGVGYGSDDLDETQMIVGAYLDKESITSSRLNEQTLKGMSINKNESGELSIVINPSDTLSATIKYAKEILVSGNTAQKEAAYLSKDAFGIASSVGILSALETKNQHLSLGVWQEQSSSDLNYFVTGIKTDPSIISGLNSTFEYAGTVHGANIVQNSNNAFNVALDFGATQENFATGSIHFDTNDKAWRASINGGGVRNSSGFAVTSGISQNGGDVAVSSGEIRGNYYGSSADAIGGTFSLNSDSAKEVGVFEASKK